MSLFKRRRSEDDAESFDDTTPDAAGGTEDPGLTEDLDTGPDAGTDDAAPITAPLGQVTTGPYDVEDAPQMAHLDLGSLRLPSVEGAEVQLQVEEASGLVTSVTVVLGESGVQLQAFAAPRSEGIWDDVRTEIAAGISAQGGTADTLEGSFGTELLGRVPAPQPDGKVGFQPVRFVGVDGPRWLLRAVFQGRSAIEPEAAQVLEQLVRDLVVVRGSDPMGPRELLPLVLPSQATRMGEPGEPAQADTAVHDQAPTSDDDLRPFERGPEITEIH